MRGFICLVFGFAIAGCNGTGPCRSDAMCASSPLTPTCDVPTGACVPARAALIGHGDGSAGSVTLTVVYQETPARAPTGFAFNPSRPNELWIVNHADDTVTTLTDPGTPSTSSMLRRDPDAIHFMHSPSGLAFAADNSWATCGENDGTQDGQPSFTGPGAFSADPAIFAKATPSGLGSHIDMLHDSPWCMGVAHERDHVFWFTDGGHQSIARYDFHAYHQPGGDDHTDGEIAHYLTGQFMRVPNVPSHLAFNPDDGMLYVADTGHQRIIKLDPRSGTPGADMPTLEPVIPIQMDNAAMTEFVPPGTLQAPSGIAVNGGYVYVTENATSKLYAFDVMTGKLVRTLDTGLSGGSVTDFTVGPDGKAYFLDTTAATVYRIDP